jgi:hypothetical protein
MRGGESGSGVNEIRHHEDVEREVNAKRGRADVETTAMVNG